MKQLTKQHVMALIVNLIIFFAVGAMAQNSPLPGQPSGPKNSPGLPAEQRSASPAGAAQLDGSQNDDTTKEPCLHEQQTLCAGTEHGVGMNACLAKKFRQLGTQCQRSIDAWRKQQNKK